MKKVIEIIVLSIFCIYFVCRMPVFAFDFNEENYFSEEHTSEESFEIQDDYEEYIDDSEIYEEKIHVKIEKVEDEIENNAFDEDSYHNHKYITDDDMYYDENGNAKIIPDLDYIIGEEDYNEIYPEDVKKYTSDKKNKADYNNPIVDRATYSKGYTPRKVECDYVIIRR